MRLSDYRIAPRFPRIPVHSPFTMRRAFMTSDNGSAQTLQPAAALAQSPRRFPGESTQYRTARNALMAEEIELRRHIERVAAQRRELPAGGYVTKDYRFEGEHGPATLSQMFGNHDPLITYNWMFGPKRERP